MSLSRVSSRSASCRASLGMRAFSIFSISATTSSPRSSLIPTWFLAIYVMVVILAPVAYQLWRRFGLLSFWLFVALAVLVDVAYFAADLEWLGWTNYFWVWLAVHRS